MTKKQTVVPLSTLQAIADRAMVEYVKAAQTMLDATLLVMASEDPVEFARVSALVAAPGSIGHLVTTLDPASVKAVAVSPDGNVVPLFARRLRAELAN